jgi:hypothetical protein
MVAEHFEKIDSDFEGTIIDLETIGKFGYGFSDSRQYKAIVPVIFGSIDSKGLQIMCAKTPDSIAKLRSKMAQMLDSLERPFHAFNSNFERGVLFHHMKKEVRFEKELNCRTFEKKADAVKLLGIPNYEDPFDDVGILCSHAWSRGEIDVAMRHNRSCLLKERDILLKRGSREPDCLQLHR